MDTVATTESTLKTLLNSLKDLLREPGCPHFSNYWSQRKEALLLFKEEMDVKIRSELWKEFVELSEEARQLKKIFDERASFAIEQIEMAILAIEQGLKNLPVLIEKREGSLSQQSTTLAQEADFFDRTHKEIALLSAYASQVQALREELMNTSMRVKIKNQFFDRLSFCGDQIFPRRKELTLLLSQAFTKAISSFMESYFVGGEFGKVPLHLLKEEIKILQMLAKEFYLHSKAFAEVRSQLSLAWDQLKNKEKERQEIYQKRREEEDKRYQEDLEKEKAKQAEHQLKQQRLEKLQEDLKALVTKVDAEEEAWICGESERLLLEALSLPMTGAQKHLFYQLQRQVKQALNLKKEKAWTLLEQSQKQDVSALQTALEKALERKREIKEELEGHRKALGISGFDFEKAMLYRELIEEAKQAFHQVSSAIEDLEAQISELEV